MHGTKYIKKMFFLLCVLCALVGKTTAQKNTKPIPPLYFNNGKLIYTSDTFNNRIPDFSYCGYKASEQKIPLVPIVAVVKQGNELDATKTIQAAIDYLATLPIQANGFRGAILIENGFYNIEGQLKINTSGIVIRGSGRNTYLKGNGKIRTTLISIKGKSENWSKGFNGLKITDAYVPVNAMSFQVDSSILTKDHSNKIVIRRPSTSKWIETLGTAEFGGGISALGWKPSDHDIYFDRTITKIEGTKVFIDAPITTALDTTFGTSTILFYTGNNRINNCAIENISLGSDRDFNNPKDEDHRWNAIDIENAEDCWVRQVHVQHFAGSAVNILESAKRITVEDVISRIPISEIGGQRRYTFLTAGQQTLFQRCYAQDGYHDFATGFCTPGPNAFVQCENWLPKSFSGTIDSWASGVLFDVVNINGNALRFGNREQDNNGAGWTAANCVFWNCTAAKIDCYKPPTAQNYALGSWAQFSGNGFWAESNNTINPRSLFYQQLKERLNKNVDDQAQILPMSTEASSSPSAEVAQQLTKEAKKPKMLIVDWIDNALIRTPINIVYNKTETKIFSKTNLTTIKNNSVLQSASIENGWFVINNLIASGTRNNVQWWSGGLSQKEIDASKFHITRFVPGRTGKGLTDDLEETTNEMVAKKIIAIDHNYGLWYDRRRDDHQRVKRMDGEVWPPFYELPFARSGKDTAWDGLSKYDLTKYNQFYWGRLKEYADLADAKGLVLMHQNYFQHNIIEAGAHYADFPWRQANNINSTNFNEPVNYAGDKRIFYAEQFYDTTNKNRKELHKKYIRQCLNNFKNNKNVIQFIGEEYTGPTHFVKFWLDVIIDWEKETGFKPLIALSVTKDVQDTILQIKKYSDVINIIDIKYWHYQADGSVYAPQGGQNLAPRQHARLLKPKKTSFEQVYRAVKEYKAKFPNKAVMYSGDSYSEFGMAVLMAGGSLPVLPSEIDKEILKAAAGMKPTALTNEEYMLTDGKRKIVYNTGTKKFELIN